LPRRLSALAHQILDCGTLIAMIVVASAKTAHKRASKNS
jgi:hypothetical protein